MKIALSRLHYPVTTLGPGRRVGIWFQGCSIRCPGCISVDTWRFIPGSATVESTLTYLTPWLDASDGVTISGGEPFDQPEALMVLLRALRRRWDKNVLVFTGHPIELLGDFLTEATGLIDALVSDPFDLSAPQTKTLRGSDNQRLHLLTQLGESLFAKYERPLTIHDKQLDIMFDDEGTAWLAGIPFRDDMYRLQELLSSQGHSSMVSMAPSTLKRTTT